MVADGSVIIMDHLIGSHWWLILVCSSDLERWGTRVTFLRVDLRNYAHII